MMKPEMSVRTCLILVMRSSMSSNAIFNLKSTPHVLARVYHVAIYVMLDSRVCLPLQHFSQPSDDGKMEVWHRRGVAPRPKTMAKEKLELL